MFFTVMDRLQPQVAGLAGDTFSLEVFMANCCIDVYCTALKLPRNTCLATTTTMTDPYL